MAYTIKVHGYAAKDPRIAGAIRFCDSLGGDEYDYTRKFLDCTGIIPNWLAAKMPRCTFAPKRMPLTRTQERMKAKSKSTRDAVRERLARMQGVFICL